MSRMLLEVIKLYQLLLSPYFRGSCRYDPSCSLYTHDAVLKYGTIRGLILGVRRIFRCQPLGSSGYDPVP